MANYYAATRTNYFRVKDADEFREFMSHVYGTEDRIELWEKKDMEDQLVFGFGTNSSIAGFRDCSSDMDEDEANDECDYDAFVEKLQTFVADDDAIIIFESGHEKLRYVTGTALVITSDCYGYLDIADLAVKHAAAMLKDPQWNTTCSY